ncbi:DUF1414 domain-containing protein [Alteromonas sediminis]|uniref:UPF0352 protein DRW07_08510 n=1 Tax=Alteromonas sediminis TaxID=2259342 RepID=A0A3N5Y3U0_9ALTE|nr:DUF1414 domain-containing protein [Alteromonas sediminis]RPJ67546.1 DUF1414 domain-containing protein [Alteromonas sediminis]
MPQKSKYTNDDVERIMNEILVVLESNKANKDLSLMVLGNVVSHVFNQHVAPAQRAELAQAFSAILQKTLDKE